LEHSNDYKDNDLSDFYVSLYWKMMHKLNLPAFEARTKQNRNGREEIFDRFRGKFVRLTSEEWVRQHFLNFLVTQKGYPPSLIVVEASLNYHRLKKRSDILVYGPRMNPCLVVECKAPEIEITQTVFDQVAMYNMSLTVDFLVVTNGLQHYACQVDHRMKTFKFLKEVPEYQEIIKLLTDKR